MTFAESVEPSGRVPGRGAQCSRAPQPSLPVLSGCPRRPPDAGSREPWHLVPCSNLTPRRPGGRFGVVRPPVWTPHVTTARKRIRREQDNMDTHVTSLTVLDLGRADIDMGVVMAPGDLDGVWAVCAFPGYLVELTDGRRVLIDTGPNRRHIDEPMYEFRGTEFGKRLVPRLAAVDDLRNRLGELGYAEADIDIVVLTHNHFDHAGNVADFPDAEIIIHRADYEIGLDHARNGRPGGIPETSLDGRPLNYRIIDGDEQIVPGLTLLHTPGHSPGHLSVAIELPE
ncbi:MAG TPA: hypothetical protein DCX80_04045, partial [Chloroflexi bacterium]|nr:hypothetical protein [Chloroflexota bacterium]